MCIFKLVYVFSAQVPRLLWLVLNVPGSVDFFKYYILRNTVFSYTVPLKYWITYTLYYGNNFTIKSIKHETIWLLTIGIVCNETLTLIYFRKTNLSETLIDVPTFFRIWLRFRGDIRKESSKESLQCHWHRRVKKYALESQLLKPWFF